MTSQDSLTNPNTSHNLHHFLMQPDSDFYSNRHFGSFGILPTIQSVAMEESGMNQSQHFLGVSSESNHSYTDQTLSLSLDSRILLPRVDDQYRQISFSPNPNYLFSGEETREVSNYCVTGASNQFTGNESYRVNGVDNSKYLKAAQSLLDEVVSVTSKEIEWRNEKYFKRLSRDDKRGSLRLRFELKEDLCHNDTITKLIALLEEVEKRFEEYYNHMEAMVLSFEAIAGLGKGKCYTALALEAMLRHFSSLRDVIVSQIYANRRKQISQDIIMPRMSEMNFFVDHQESRSNDRVSLQQIGMLQSSRQIWRPIRGLPENAVAILRAWLFEHFLHPYPKDNEKLVLASQTGLTKNQVSNWFINARVRLWKPMIEEMYKEEFEELDE